MESSIEKKHVLLLSYYYPPYTGIEANRVYSWACSLSVNGYKVTVVTRQWKAGGQHEWKDYFSEYFDSNRDEERVSDLLTVVRVPYKWNKQYKFFKPLPFSSAYYWINRVLGNLHIDTDAYHSLKDTAAGEMGKQVYDFIIVSSPPLNIVRLGVELKQKFNIPLIVDFRDSFNNDMLNPRFVPTLKEKLAILLYKRHLARWLPHAAVITGVSQAVLDTLPIIRNQKQVIVMNGYEKEAINTSNDVKPGFFIISLVGSIYPEQDIDFMINGLAAFIKKSQPDKLLIQFIGIGSRLNIREKIEAKINSKYLHFTNRVPKEQAIAYMHNSTILLQVGWRGYKGFCPGKVFEYMAAKRTILIAPADGDLTDKIVRETKTGRSVNTIEGMVDYLADKYKEWEKNGVVAYYGNDGEIEKYSRANQNLKLIEALKGFA